MTDKQLIREYLKKRYPIGKEIYDSTRGEMPYVINKRTVFEIHRWEKEDYNPDFLPDNRDKYNIDLLVRNPGKYSPSYSLRTTDMRTVKTFLLWKEKADDREEKLLKEHKELRNKLNKMKTSELFSMSLKLKAKTRETLINLIEGQINYKKLKKEIAKAK